MNIAIIVVGVLIVVLLSKALARHFKKSRNLSDKEAQLKGLKVMLFSLVGVIALGVVVSAVLPSLNLALQANRYQKHAQTVDINEFLPSNLKTTPAVWIAADKQSGACVYLMGSIHILTDKTLPFPDYVTEVYNKCETLAVEKIPSDSSEPYFGAYKLSSRKIYDELSDATYRSAKDFLMSRGLYFEHFDDYNADFWYSLVYEAVVSGIKNIDYTKGVDQYFIELAQKDGKQLIGIDSSIEGGLPTPSIELEEYMICDLLSNSERAAADLAEVYANWAGGDIDKLIEVDWSKIPKELLDDYARYQKALTTDRNVVMTDNIEKLLQQGDDAFVIVGAAHFAGDEGIISLLEQRGYSVDRIG